MRRPAKIALWLGGGLLGLIVVVLVAGYFVLRSDWLREKVRQRIVAEVEKASGGKSAIGSFRFDWNTMQASVHNFVLHGTEPVGEAPLFQADSIQVGLKIVSVFRRKVDLASLVVDRPKLHIMVAADGTTNFPSPKTQRSGKDPVQTLLDLAVGEFQLRNGYIDYDSRRIPLEAHGDNLNVKLAYDATVPRYSGDVSFEAIHIKTPSIEPLDLSTRLSVALERNRLVVSDAKVHMKDSEILLSGTVTGFKHPQGSFDMQARLAMAELAPKLHLPIERRGTVVMTGKAGFGGTLEYAFNGKMSGNGLGIRKGVNVQNIGLRSDVYLDPKQIDLKGVRVSALGGSFAGSGHIEEFDRFRFQGDVRGFSLQDLAAAGNVKQLAWNGTVAGPVKVQGRLRKTSDLVAEVHLDIAPAPGPMPVEGVAEVRYVARGEQIELGHTWIRTPNSRVDVMGTLGRSLDVQVHSTGLNDFLPAIAMASANPPKELPVKLQKGSFDFSGTVTGPLKSPVIQGQTTAVDFEVEGQKINRLEATFRADSQGVEARTFALARGQMNVKGTLQLGLVNWKPVDSSRLSASVVVDNADLHALLVENKQNLPIEGVASLRLQAAGTLGTPEGTALLVVSHPVMYGQSLDHIRADFRVSGRRFQVINGRLELGNALVSLNATYDHTGKDWKNGLIRFEVAGSRFQLAQFKAVKDRRPDLDGELTLSATGTARVVNLKPELALLNGQVGLNGITIKKWRAGSVTVNAQTQNDVLNVQARANLEGSQPIEATATVRLAGDYPATGRMTVPNLNVATVNHLRKATGSAGDLPFAGMIEGGATFAGPLRKSSELTGRITLTKVQVSPVESGALGNAGVRRDLTVANNGPVEVVIDAKAAHIQHAEFTARDTKIAAAGTVGFNANTGWDLRLEGTLNLAIARSFSNNLRTEGKSTFNIGIRGPIGDPELTGQMELQNASFNYAELPNGISDANGTVVFDRNRATISKLTGRSGGGEVSLSGFVGFGTGAMLYRLGATATNVRVRYPEGTSTTVSSTLNLSGNSDQSLLSGTVTIERVGFRPKTDVGGLLASAQPVTTPSAPNETLRNMQLDIRIQTSANAEFSTSYTQDVRAEADLRLRGNAARPSLLGRVNILQGQVLFFGNHYTINRGDVSFYNPTRIEPVLDLNLQTDVRGITVTINFSGTLQRLNMTYRSDPPMQTQEIVALLAVGRAPTAGSGLASGQTVTNTSVLNTGANTLLGQAIASPVSNRLQRFFGVSRLKIDPLLQGTSVDTTPQARLTLEQQISPNVTLTYVTNVTKSQQQLVRLQWDVNRQWSVIAIRDENGIFGIDFQYKRRF